MKKIEKYTKQDNFLPQILMQKSVVAGALCAWVRSVEEYHKALKIVRQKIAQKETAEALVQQLEDQFNKAMQDEVEVLEQREAQESEDQAQDQDMEEQQQRSEKAQTQQDDEEEEEQKEV